MVPFFVAFRSILPLFLIMFTGSVLVRLKAADRQWVEVLNRYALWIGLPSLIFTALIKLHFRFGDYAYLILDNSIYLVCCVLLAFPVAALFRCSPKMRRTLFLLFGFGNISYLGIPLLTTALGTEALGPAILLSAIYPFWMFTLALILIEITGHEKVLPTVILKKLITNPLLIAVLAGAMASAFNIPIAEEIMKPLELFGQSVTAIVLFSLGIFLGTQQRGSRREWGTVLAITLVMMIVLPALFFLFARKGGMSPLQLQASVLDAAMPMGLTAYAMTQQYDLDALLTGRLVILSTLLAVIILPAWIVITA